MTYSYDMLCNPFSIAPTYVSDVDNENPTAPKIWKGNYTSIYIYFVILTLSDNQHNVLS